MHFYARAAVFVIAIVIAGASVGGYLSRPESVRSSQLAASAIPATGPSFTCYGGSVFVYSRDFLDAPLKDISRPSQGVEVRCSAPSPLALRFAEGLSLNDAEVCKLLMTSPSICGEAYYAVVPKTGQLKYGILSYELAGGLCGVKTNGQVVQFADCLAKEASIHQTARFYSSTIQPSKDISKVSPVSLTPERSFWDFANDHVTARPVFSPGSRIPDGGMVLFKFKW